MKCHSHHEDRATKAERSAYSTSNYIPGPGIKLWETSGTCIDMRWAQKGGRQGKTKGSELSRRRASRHARNHILMCTHGERVAG